MKLFSFRMRAISLFILDGGTSTRRCFDPQALRIRVNMSAIGSVIDILSFPLPAVSSRTCGIKSDASHRLRTSYCALRTNDLGPLWVRSTRYAVHSALSPAGLPHAWNHPVQRQLAEADAADAEAAQVRARAATAPAAVVLLHAELWLALALLDQGLLRHCLFETSSAGRRGRGGRSDRRLAAYRRFLFIGAERHPQLAQQRERLVVPVRRRHERDVH